MRWVLRIAVFAVLVAIGAAGVVGLSHFSPREIVEPPASLQPAEQAPYVPPPAVGAQWRYTTPQLAGAGAPGVQACTRAQGDVAIAGGAPSAVLFCLRRGGGYPYSASIALADTKGRFACGDCALRASLDGAPHGLDGSTASTDGAAYTIFFHDGAGVAAALRRAGTLTVTLPIQGGATQTATFDVAGLRWD